MNKIKFKNNSTNVLSISNYWLVLVLFNVVMAGCDNPADPTKELNVDRDIPASEDFDASYGFWGPEGSTIYFTHSEELGSNPDPGLLDQLWKLDLKTGRRENIHDGRILNADISPDGQWFVFHSFSVPSIYIKYAAMERI